MAFTDEDLKQFKESVQSMIGHPGRVGIDPGVAKELIARLECAESILNNGIALTHTEDCDKTEHHDLECTCGSQDRWDRWRKAAGK